jgi:hypothetical protein
MENQETSQLVVVSQATVDPELGLGRVALFDESGDPIATDDLVKATPPTGEDVLLTGFEAGTVDDVEATDTINEAIAKVEAKADADPTGADVLLTGFEAGEAGDVAATDTVNEALAKLVARVAALESPS